MTRKTKVLLAVVTLVALLLIASRCSSSSGGGPYSSGQHGVNSSPATASAPTAPTRRGSHVLIGIGDAFEVVPVLDSAEAAARAL